MPDLPGPPVVKPGAKPHVLVAGLSTRAAAESAGRAGFRVTAIDAFGDLDQHPTVAALKLERKFSAHAAAIPPTSAATCSGWQCANRRTSRPPNECPTNT